MNSIHTDPSQINDFNRIASANGFERIEITKEARKLDTDNRFDEAEQEQQESQQTVPTDTLLTPILKTTFGVACPNWKITDEQFALLAQAYAPVVDKYDLFKYISVEVNALIMTVIIFQPFAGTPKRLPKDQQQPQTTQAPQQPAPATEPQQEEILGGFTQ